MFRALARAGRNVASALSGEVPGLDARPTSLFKFNAQNDIDRWHVFTDIAFGGRSQAELRLSDDRQSMVFQGHCTVDQEEGAEMKRAGYCSASSKIMRLGDYFDLERYSHLVYVVKGDGRTYIANVRTDALSDGSGDVWQVPFKTRKDSWVEVRIPFSAFAMTFQGQLVGYRHWLPHDRVMSIGIAVSMLAPQQQQQQATVMNASSSSSSGSLGGSSSSRSSETNHEGPVQYRATTGDTGGINDPMLTHAQSVAAAGTGSSASPGGMGDVTVREADSSAVSSSSSTSSSTSSTTSLQLDEVVKSEGDETDPLGFDFRLEIQEIRAEVG